MAHQTVYPHTYRYTIKPISIASPSRSAPHRDFGGHLHSSSAPRDPTAVATLVLGSSTTVVASILADFLAYDVRPPHPHVGGSPVPKSLHGTVDSSPSSSPCVKSSSPPNPCVLVFIDSTVSPASSVALLGICHPFPTTWSDYLSTMNRIFWLVAVCRCPLGHMYGVEPVVYICPTSCKDGEIKWCFCSNVRWV